MKLEHREASIPLAGDTPEEEQAEGEAPLHAISIHPAAEGRFVVHHHHVPVDHMISTRHTKHAIRSKHELKQHIAEHADKLHSVDGGEEEAVD